MECSLVYSQEVRAHSADRLEKLVGKALIINSKDLKIDDKLSSLGDGAFSEVKLGKYAGVHVACKYFVKGAHFHDFDPLKREIEIHSQLRHPHIVALIGVVVRPQPCVVTEFLRVGTLRKIIRERSNLLTDNVRAKLIREIAVVRYYIGMLYLHMKRILHRDLRCGNVLISHNWHAKIGDFNLACTFDEPNKKSHGANAWMAPEVLDDPSSFCSQSDVYSFSFTMWEIFALTQPPRYYSVEEARNEVVQKRYRPPVPDSAQNYGTLMESCWCHELADRPRFSEILDSLDSLTPDSTKWNEINSTLCSVESKKREEAEDYPDDFSFSSLASSSPSLQ